MSPILVIDVLAAVGFAFAAAIIIATPANEQSVYSLSTKLFMLSAVSLYAVVLAGDVVTFFIESQAFQVAEGYIEMLFPVLALLAGFSAAKQEQYLDASSAQRALSKSYEMTMTIVDSAPCGILVIDPNGWITFANDVARETLDLFDVPERGQMDQPGWLAGRIGPDGEPAESADELSFLLEAPGPETSRVLFTWPNGWRVELKMAVSPLRDASGGIGGAVVTFERPGRSRLTPASA